MSLGSDGIFYRLHGARIRRPEGEDVKHHESARAPPVGEVNTPAHGRIVVLFVCRARVETYKNLRPYVSVPGFAQRVAPRPTGREVALALCEEVQGASLSHAGSISKSALCSLKLTTA